MSLQSQREERSDESLSTVDSSVPLMCYDPSDFGLLILIRIIGPDLIQIIDPDVDHPRGMHPF